MASEIERRLRIHGLEVQLRPTLGPEHAIALARESTAESDVLVAVGGDGTINEVVNGMAEAADATAGAGRPRHDCRLGIVPAAR